MPEDDDRIVISRKVVMDAWFEAQQAIVAEIEARKEFERLHEICDEKKRKFRDLIDFAEDYENKEE